MRDHPSCSTRLRRFAGSVRASTAVEFALLAPVFLFLVMGMAGYGIYFGASHSVQQIAADAARSSVAGLTQAERQAIVAAYVTANAGGYPFIDPRRLTVETHDSLVDGSQFVVTATYDAGELPIWHLMDRLVIAGSTIRRQSIIRIGGL